MRIPKEILEMAFKIGFKCSNETNLEQAIFSVPCSVKLKNGNIFEQVEMLLIEKLHIASDYKFFQIEDVASISESRFALSEELRNASLNTPEYRNDWPFFIETKDGNILGYNAISPVNFTYKNDVLGSDVVKVLDFKQAQSRGFEFIKDHSKLTIKILCGYDVELIKKIMSKFIHN